MSGTLVEVSLFLDLQHCQLNVIPQQKYTWAQHSAKFSGIISNFFKTVHNGQKLLFSNFIIFFGRDGHFQRKIRIVNSCNLKILFLLLFFFVGLFIISIIIFIIMIQQFTIRIRTNTYIKPQHT